MRKVELNLKENHQYKVIKKLVESDGSKNRAAIKLNCSIRHVNRLINRYKTQGKKGFVHGNKNREPVNKISKELRTKILDLYCTEIPTANFKHATEILDEYFNIQISDTSLNTICRGNYILSPKAQRKTKREAKKLLKQLRTAASKGKEIEETNPKTNKIVALMDAHPRRPRSANFGELAQMDSSEYIWLVKKKVIYMWL